MPSRNDAELFDNVKQYVALIGRGQKSGKTLSRPQAKHLMLKLLNGESLPEQTGAALMLLRMREETVDELAGFLEACRETSSLSIEHPITYDFGCYAGKRRHLPWFLLAALALAESGEKVFLHGLEEHDSQRLYLDEVYRELGWRMAETSAEANRQLAEYGFSYMSIAQFHPAMTDLLQTRHILGLRSCLHSLSKMLNPTNATCSIHGIFHRDLDTTHIDVAALLDDNNVACIRGDSGEVEATPEKAFVMHSYERSQTKQRKFTASLTNWSLQTRKLGAQALKQIWTGEDTCSYGEHAVISTLAVALACRHGLSVEDALTRATTLWQSRSKKWPQIN